jgi:hypothetical protein
MSGPLVPSPLDYIGRRPFAFYPPIRHATPNSWLLGVGSWSEVQVINSRTGRELWLPRQYIGAVGHNQDSLTVGLTQHVELRDGKILPRSPRRVIEMPSPKDVQVAAQREGPAAIIGIRLEKTTAATFQNGHFRTGIFILFVVGLLALVASASR